MTDQVSPQNYFVKFSEQTVTLLKGVFGDFHGIFCGLWIIHLNVILRLINNKLLLLLLLSSDALKGRKESDKMTNTI